MEITGATAIIGFVNGISLLLDGQYKSFAKFAVALVVGAILGYLNYFGINGVEAGIGIALSSSGIYKIAQVAFTSSK
ncbi:MAG: hypothetical protein QXY47_05285 [Thermoplasmata archaeon]